VGRGYGQRAANKKAGADGPPGQYVRTIIDKHLDDPTRKPYVSGLTHFTP
jgi:hypothetical protein